MNQYWDIVNVDKREILYDDNCLSLKRLLRNGTCKRLAEVLTVPSIPPFKTDFNQLHAARVRNSSSILFLIPQEMLDHITSFLSAEDKIRLALSCTFLFRVLGPTIRQLIMEDEAPWAGDRLVLVSDLAHDVPQSCAEFRRDSVLNSVGLTLRHGIRVDDEADSTTGSDSEEEQEAIWARQNPLYHIHKRTRYGKSLLQRRVKRRMTEKERSLFTRLVQAMTTCRAGSRGRVLRNLDTRQYVLDSVLGLGDSWENLGRAICLKSIWTEVPLGLLHLEGIDVNEWAGHRFDIISADDLDEGWEDRSHEAIRLLQRARTEVQGQ